MLSIFRDVLIQGFTRPVEFMGRSPLLAVLYVAKQTKKEFLLQRIFLSVPVLENFMVLM